MPDAGEVVLDQMMAHGCGQVRLRLRWNHAEHSEALSTEGHYHFITFSCYQRLPYLNSARARILFEEALEKLRLRHGFFLFGYVLMTEHVHLLLGEPKLHSLATTMSVLKGETSKLLKGDRPQFWQTRYYDFNVFTQKKFAEKIDYIHSNPVARGLAEKPEDWPWSSSHHWSNGEQGRIEIESHWTWTRREKASTPPLAIKPR